MRAYTRTAAAVLALAGMAAIAWVAVTLVWGEPYTAMKAERAQAALRDELAREDAAWASGARVRPDSPTTLRERAASFRARLLNGDAVGRIVVPRLRLRTVMVEGTDATNLARGPGHYPMTSLPGLGGTVAVAGHRTTYSHPFRHIDDLRPGDSIRLELPYGTFHYTVYAQKIVDDRDWTILRRRAFEKLVLSACHPLYSAAQRIVVFARLRTR
jgi:sortase A